MTVWRLDMILFPLLLCWTALLVGLAQGAPKLLLCSDSTASEYKTGQLQGWGHYLGEYMSIPVHNLAIAGRSTRSFMNEGSWAKLLAQTSPGDYVVIEMGHNDEADPTKGDKYAERGTLAGIGYESKTIMIHGKEERVHTFGHYLRVMIEGVQERQAVPILSGMVPRNYWNGTKLRSDWPFATYARQIASIAKIEYIDHTAYSVKRFGQMGPAKSKTYYPSDNTHTNPEGAKVNADTFVEALKCARSVLIKHLNSRGQAVKTAC